MYYYYNYYNTLINIPVHNETYTHTHTHTRTHARTHARTEIPEGGGRGRLHLTLHCPTRMTPAFRWAAMRTISMKTATPLKESRLLCRRPCLSLESRIFSTLFRLSPKRAGLSRVLFTAYTKLLVDALHTVRKC